MSLTFNTTFEPRHGEAVPVAPNIVRVTAPNVGPMTFHGTNTYLVGAAHLVVIDPGPDDDRHLASLLRAIDGRTVEAILLTHGHLDHRGLATRLAGAVGAPLMVGRAMAEADRVLADGEELRLAGERFEVVATPGHTSDHLGFALPDRGVLLCGDHVMGWSTTVVAPPDGSMRDYLESLDRLAARSETLYLPGHGGPIERPHAYLRALKGHRRLREATIVDRLRARDATVPDLVAALYKGLEPSLVGAASLSVLAHLQDLVEQDRVWARPAFGPAATFGVVGRAPTPPA